jgi:hypothetical protein
MTQTYFLCSALLLVLILQPFTAAEAKEIRRVLVLYSEDKDNPSQETTGQGIREGFRSNPSFDVQLLSCSCHG